VVDAPSLADGLLRRERGRDLLGGTEGSNQSPSSGESAANPGSGRVIYRAPHGKPAGQ
jgi:hypothetical protein